MGNFWNLPLLHSVSDVSRVPSQHQFTSAMPCHAHAVPLPCFELTVLKAITQGHGKAGRGAAWAQHGICELALAAARRPVGDLLSFGFFRQPNGVPRRLLSETQTEMQLASVKPTDVCHGRGEADYFGARTRVLCNIQHKDYDNNLMNNNV
jgi:hypothetical protein